MSLFPVCVASRAAFGKSNAKSNAYDEVHTSCLAFLEAFVHNIVSCPRTDLVSEAAWIASKSFLAFRGESLSTELTRISSPRTAAVLGEPGADRLTPDSEPGEMSCPTQARRPP